MRRAYKFRLYPNAAQIRELGVMLETHRRIYNAALAQRKASYEIEHRSLRYEDQSRWFKEKREENPWFAKTNFSSAQATLRRLDKAFVAFFRRVKAKQKPGFPRFKGRDRFFSVEFPSYRDGIKLMGAKLRVQHVGDMRINVHRPTEGQIKTVRLLQEGEKWYAIFSCDLGDIKAPPSVLPPVGIDVGLESFLTTSEGEHVPNPRYLKRELPALRRAGRAVSRKKKGGKNRRKAVRRIRLIYSRVGNLRREHRHKVALDLIRRYGLVAVEHLNIKGMLGNRRLSRAIADAGWSGFLATLRHKAERAGAEVVEVDPKGTSRECSRCGAEVRKSLSVRRHDCPRCGLSLHRDHNAALNILARARRARTGPVGLKAAS